MKTEKIRRDFEKQDNDFLHHALQVLRHELYNEVDSKCIALKRRQIKVIKEILLHRNYD